MTAMVPTALLTLAVPLVVKDNDSIDIATLPEPVLIYH